MAIIITGNNGATAFQGLTPRGFYANNNHAPNWCEGAITSDKGLTFLRRITGAG